MVETELPVVAAGTEREVDADHADFLGAGEQPRIDACIAADRNGLRLGEIVGLVGAQIADQVRRVARLQLGVGVGQQRRGPVFVGDAEPRVGGVEGDRLGIVDLLVAVFLQAIAAEITDQAFMQDVIAGDLRRAVARDQRERIERHRRVADIADVVLDGEEIALVDRDGAAEGEAFAIVVFQHGRRGRRQRAAAFLLPLGVAVGHARGRAGGGHPAEFGVIGRGGAGRRIQHDRRRGRVDGVAELDQREIVDAPSLQRDAADQARGLDLDALRFGQRLIAADDGRGRRSGRGGR